MLFWIGLEMIEFCYQDTIGDYLVPNGTPPLILKKMKEMDNPSEAVSYTHLTLPTTPYV